MRARFCKGPSRIPPCTVFQANSQPTPRSIWSKAASYDTQAVRDRMEADWDRWFEHSAAGSEYSLAGREIASQPDPHAPLSAIVSDGAVRHRPSPSQHHGSGAGEMGRYTAQRADRLCFGRLRDRWRRTFLISIPRWFSDTRISSLIPKAQWQDCLPFSIFLSLRCQMLLPDCAMAIPSIQTRNVFPPDSRISRASRWGYSAASEVGPFTPIVRHPLRAVREATTAALLQTS